MHTRKSLKPVQHSEFMTVHYVIVRSARIRIVGADEDTPEHLAVAARHKGLMHKLVVSVIFEREASLGLRPALH